MKLLITGGSGYIARNLKSLFTSNGYDVLAPPRTELDLCNLEVLVKYFNKNNIDAVIHAALKIERKSERDTFENIYLPNIQMYENLERVLANREIPMIIIGSGAEFDRRYDITNAREGYINSSWPIDPYGLSKNIISRRRNCDMWVLRLFGCFNQDESNSRFIKRSILNLKNNLPIEIYQNKIMDFFYLDDVFIVANHILNHGGPNDINLVYHKNKYDLITLSGLIYKHIGISTPTPVSLKIFNRGADYFGCGEVLYNLNLPLIGLEEGIKRTINNLL